MIHRFAFRLMILMSIAALTLAACANVTPTPAGPAVAVQPTAAALQQVQQIQEPVGPVLGTLTIEAVDIGFEPTNLTVDNPGRYTIKLVNTGNIVHDIVFPNGLKIVAQAGETQEGDVMVPEGGLTFICSLPGHKDAGMVGSISVAGHTLAAGEGSDHGGPPPAFDIQPDANAPAYELFDAAAPPVMQGEIHDIELVMVEREMTVAEGVVQGVGPFGGTVPGPVIRGKVGELV
ncbi:MAG TPA: hypothetical protein PKC19_01060, partial [Roseiflexaceae bacterium]|nr:hypothetical protein [Roseiflexaceae bacterium]